jgi:hypothetical protein
MKKKVILRHDGDGWGKPIQIEGPVMKIPDVGIKIRWHL